MANRLIQFFVFSHLPNPLQEISRPYADMAVWLDDNLPESPEKTVALRKLLESKDCAVRARLEQRNKDDESDVKV